MAKDAVLKIASLLVALRCSAALCAFGADPGETIIADQEIKLSTGVIEREWAIRDGVFRTTRIRSLARPAEWSILQAAEFRMELEDGRKIDTSAFRVRSCSRQRVGNADTVELELAGRDESDRRVKISLRAEAGKSFLTKTVGFRSPDRVDRIEVESLPKPGPLALGGMGQPLFVADEWFIGSEHPAGINDAERSELYCALHPGCLQRDGMSSVVGCRDAADHSIDDAFRRYVDTFMPPVGPQLQYNSWFDLRDREVEPGKLAQRFDSFQKKLLQPYGLRFDAFVIDDGFQNPKSIWQLNGRWLSNIDSLREKVEATGSRLGLWLPLNGHKLDVAFGAQHLLEASNNRKPAYCLAGSKYRAALEAAIASLLDKGNFAYFKHDFNFLRCSAAGHGHLETAEHGRQAGVDGQLEILNWEKKQRPNLVRNLTSNIWLSPWWLRSAEFLWLGGADYGQNWRLPTSNARAPEMTFRDIEAYRRLRIERAQIPLHRLMMHGVIRGRYDNTAPIEDLKEWSDYVVWFCARGTMLQELYVTPERMPDSFWSVLAAALQWARHSDNVECFRWSRMIGGNPESGEPYGYVHWGSRKAIVAIRNPTTVPVNFRVPLDSRPGHFPSQERWRPVVVYPYRRILQEQSVAGDLRVDIASDSLAVVELYPALPDSLKPMVEKPSDAPRFAVSKELNKGTGQQEVDIEVLPKPVALRILTWEREKNRFKATFEVDDPRKLEIALTTTEFPAGGSLVAVRVEGKVAPVPSSISTHPDGQSWQRCTYRFKLSADRPTFEVEVNLPPTPVYPERVQFEATVEFVASFSGKVTNKIGRGTLPHWPLCISGDDIRTERILTQQLELTRRRSTSERIVWLALLLGPPIVVIAIFVARIDSRFTRSLVHWIVVSLMVLAWIAALVLTPMGAVVGRLL